MYPLILGIRSLFKYNVELLLDTCGVWLYGPPLTGKVYSIYSYFDEYLFVKIKVNGGMDITMKNMY